MGQQKKKCTRCGSKLKTLNEERFKIEYRCKNDDCRRLITIYSDRKRKVVKRV
jgi:hypothetical protein